MMNTNNIIPKKEEPITSDQLIDNINFNELYVCKGVKGIFLILSMPNKSGLVGIRKWDSILDPNRKSLTVKYKNLIKLGDIIFHTEKEEDLDLTLKEVFRNLNSYEETLPENVGIEDVDLENKDTVTNLMKIAVPNYDQDSFKDYHLKKLIKYYTWTKESMSNILS